ncbi:pentatricopeptide repeat-containing protein At4g38150-like [Chenopodium quinoa]|uniref:Pentatricopeptide repeat-containing protein n=1 Tax=Chenopodium quinoa TaxID=63459 RepID=A0A803L116_CHEQI|nr:pentatricopeptide repeat-containing protein At4g38150-like [Chenopodium quinoa]
MAVAPPHLRRILRRLFSSHPLNSASSFSLLLKPLSSTSKSPLFSPFNINSTRQFTSSEPESEPTGKNPFSNKPTILGPKDPRNLQQVFQRMRTEGLISNAVKMFDEMSNNGLTHETLEMFKEIKQKGKLPDVVAHTAVIEAYANAGQCKEAEKVFLRMLPSGVLPNVYTYSVLIKALATGGMLDEAKEYVLEMLGKGMRPNAGVCVAVFEAFVREGKELEGKQFLKQMKGLGFVGDEKGVREFLMGKKGYLVKNVINILCAK